MQTRICKWGNSLALRIPKSVADEAQLEVGSAVELSCEDSKLIVLPMRRKKISLDELLAGVCATNRHAEVNWDAPAGNEAW